MEVRDPLHGAILVQDDEAVLVDHPFVQRLRGIKQMGFSELPFPGAVHTRYMHSLGCMELAGRAFDAAFRRDPFSSPGRRQELRQAVRIAALCHDLGHAPFSHCTEFAMPPLRALGVDAYTPSRVAHRLDERASHEDYTIAILTRSSLAEAIGRGFPFSGRHIASLVSQEVEPPDDFFVDRGLDFRRICAQLISSELDVDRLDYLGRDSYFSGARYGQVDVPWLLSCLEWHEAPADRAGGGPTPVSLGFDRRAIYAFDDFMIARYHMFVMVYFHHKSVVFEEMLKRHFTGPDCRYTFPADAEGFCATDDIHLHGYLRGRTDEWARRIVERRPYRRCLELHGSPAEVQTTPVVEALAEAGIDCLSASSTGKLSRYAAMGRKRGKAPQIYVIERGPGLPERATALEKATRIFERYEEERQIARVYVREDQVDAAKAIVRRSLPAEWRATRTEA